MWRRVLTAIGIVGATVAVHEAAHAVAAVRGGGTVKERMRMLRRRNGKSRIKCSRGCPSAIGREVLTTRSQEPPWPEASPVDLRSLQIPVPELIPQALLK